MPRNITSVVFFYVYVLLSLKDGNHYVGYTTDLRKRIEEHKKGLVFSTKTRRPLTLIYFEGCRNEQDAKQRERYLKMTIGRRWLGTRLRNFNKKLM
ncbi:MAG: GIY-YIG nuclease family protein [bacterium]|nr:GIY-YIG nuclease family protein [bacterium]